MIYEFFWICGFELMLLGQCCNYGCKVDFFSITDNWFLKPIIELITEFFTNVAGTERCYMHCSGMQVIINAWSLAVISYDGIERKGQTTNIMLMVTHTTADGSSIAPLLSTLLSVIIIVLLWHRIFHTSVRCYFVSLSIVDHPRYCVWSSLLCYDSDRRWYAVIYWHTILIHECFQAINCQDCSDR